MKYKRLLDNNLIAEHETSAAEIKELFAVAERDIKDACLTGLSDDRAFATAYNAGLQLCTIIMAAEGYRTRGSNHHRTTFDFVEESGIKAISEMAGVFDKFRRKRNDIDYDRTMVVSEKEKKEIISIVTQLKNLIKEWLKNKMPEVN
jgi:hypothetical protein